MEASYGKLYDESNKPIIVIKPELTPPIVVPIGNAIEPFAFAEIDVCVPKYTVESETNNDFTCISLNPLSLEPILIFV